TAPQKEMQNGAMQLRNILKAFQVIEPRSDPGQSSGLAALVHRVSKQVHSVLGARPVLPPVPVLLVDDVVDSGWTLTLSAILLRAHGSGPVFPFALAKASLRGS